MSTISFDDFMKVDVRSGTVLRTEEFPRAKKPAFKVWVDFGDPYGVRQTSAQITHHYTLEGLIGKKVMGALNLGERNIAGFMSQFLLLGFEDEAGFIVLADPGNVPNGRRMG